MMTFDYLEIELDNEIPETHQASNRDKECVERGLDPLTTNLVVADVSRTEV